MYLHLSILEYCRYTTLGTSTWLTYGCFLTGLWSLRGWAFSQAFCLALMSSCSLAVGGCTAGAGLTRG